RVWVGTWQVAGLELQDSKAGRAGGRRAADAVFRILGLIAGRALLPVALLIGDGPQYVDVQAPFACSPNKDFTSCSGEISVNAGHKFFIGLLGEIFPYGELKIFRYGVIGLFVLWDLLRVTL